MQELFFPWGACILKPVVSIYVVSNGKMFQNGSCSVHNSGKADGPGKCCVFCISFDKRSGVLTRLRPSYSVCVGCLRAFCAYTETNFNIKYVMARWQKNGLRKKDLERTGTCTG